MTTFSRIFRIVVGIVLPPVASVVLNALPRSAVMRSIPGTLELGVIVLVLLVGYLTLASAFSRRRAILAIVYFPVMWVVFMTVGAEIAARLYRSAAL